MIRKSEEAVHGIWTGLSSQPSTLEATAPGDFNVQLILKFPSFCSGLERSCSRVEEKSSLRVQL
jgi:hypothetical protein